MPGLHPLSPRARGGAEGGRRGCTTSGLPGETGAKGTAAAAAVRREGRVGWRDACSRFPYRRGTVVCAFMKICQTHPRPLPHPRRSLRRPPSPSYLSAPSVPSPRTSCNDRIRASGGRSLAIVVFPRFYSRCDRCIIAKGTISARSAVREEVRGRGGRER